MGADGGRANEFVVVIVSWRRCRHHRGLLAPPTPADDARDLRPAPNNLRVVTDVDHNVHTIRDPSRNRHRAQPSLLDYVGAEYRLRLME